MINENRIAWLTPEANSIDDSTYHRLETKAYRNI